MFFSFGGETTGRGAFVKWGYWRVEMIAALTIHDWQERRQRVLEILNEIELAIPAGRNTGGNNETRHNRTRRKGA